MKRFLSVILCVLCIALPLTLCSCGGKNEEETTVLSVEEAMSSEAASMEVAAEEAAEAYSMLEEEREEIYSDDVGKTEKGKRLVTKRDDGDLYALYEVITFKKGKADKKLSYYFCYDQETFDEMVGMKDYRFNDIVKINKKLKLIIDKCDYSKVEYDVVYKQFAEDKVHTIIE